MSDWAEQVTNAQDNMNHMLDMEKLQAESNELHKQNVELRQQVERLRAQLDEENWLGCLIDRLNEFARENANLFAECRNGREASILIQQMHGEFNSLRIRLDRYRELVNQLVTQLKKAVLIIDYAPGLSVSTLTMHALLARCEGEKK